MDLLPDIDVEFEPKCERRKPRKNLIIAIVILLLAAFAAIGFSSSIYSKVEIKLKEKYDQQIIDLQNEINDTKAKYEKKISEANEKNEKKLADQKESYEKKLSNSDEKHQKEIEKKDAKIKEQEDKIQLLEALEKISFDEIETQIKTVGKLTTIDYHYTYAGTHEDTLQFFNNQNPHDKEFFCCTVGRCCSIGCRSFKSKD